MSRASQIDTARDLEFVNARQQGQPGGVSLGCDPIVAALIGEGEEAVEPLLRCLEEDTRLTRSVHFWRDFDSRRHLIGVHEAAYVALAEILKTSFFEAESTGDDLTAHGVEGRKRVAARIRAYWNAYAGLPLEERWFRTLASDTASPGRWVEAAENIVTPVDVTVSWESMSLAGWVRSPIRRPGERPAMRGEALRARCSPSVGDILHRRIRELLACRDDPQLQRANAAVQLAIALAQWDEANCMEALRGTCRELVRRFASSRDCQGDAVVRPIVDLHSRLLACGDGEAGSEYVAWLKSLGSTWVLEHPSLLSMVLEPFWTHAEDPAIRRGSEWLFEDPESWWCGAVDLRETILCEDLVGSPLLNVDGFREIVLRELTNADRARETRLPVSVWLRNRSGIDRNVATGPAHFQLFRSRWGGLPVDPRLRGEPERWEELRPVSPARVPPLRSSQPLGATGEWRACDSTLRDHYPDLEPGRYRLVLVFEDASADLASGKSNELMFDLD